MTAQVVRLAKLEAAAVPCVHVVRQADGETLEEAWRLEKGERPMPGPRDLLVLVRLFFPPASRSAYVPAS